MKPPRNRTRSALALTLALAVALAVAAGCGRPPHDIPRVGAPQDGPLRIDPGWEPPAAMLDWQYVILHHSATNAGCAASFDRWHRSKGWDGLGYHFVIGNGEGSPDGAVEVSYRWTRQLTGAHVGGENNIGKIGVCLVGNFEAARPTPAQMAALRRLIEFLQVRCRIPAARVCGHYEVTRPGYTRCPGKHLCMSELRASLAAAPRPYQAAAVRVRR